MRMGRSGQPAGSASIQEQSGSPAGQEISYLAEGLGVNFAGTVLGRGLRFLLNAVLARLFGVQALGIYSLLMAVAAVMSKLSLMGLELGLVRYVSLHHKSGRHRDLHQTISAGVLISLLISSIVAVVICLAGPTVASTITETEAGLLRLVALSLPFTSLIILLTSALTAMGQVKYKVIVLDLSEPLVTLAAATVVYLVAGPVIAGPAAAYLSWVIVATVLAAVFFSRSFSIGQCLQNVTRVPRWRVRELVRFSVPMGLSGGINIVVQRLDLLLLGFYLPVPEVGLYSAAAQLSLLFSVLLQGFRTVYMPMVPALGVRGDFEGLRRNLSLVTRWILLLGVPLVVLFFLSGSLLLTIFGSEFAAANVSLAILTVGQAFNIGAGLSGVTLAMAGHSRLHLLDNVLALVCFLAIGLFLIPRLGIVGAAIAQASSRAVFNLLAVLQLYRRLHIHPYEWATAKPLLAGVLAALTAWLVGTWWHLADAAATTVLLDALFGIVYIALLYMMGFEQGDRQMAAVLMRRFLPAARKVH